MKPGHTKRAPEQFRLWRHWIQGKPIDHLLKPGVPPPKGVPRCRCALCLELRGEADDGDE